MENVKISKRFIIATIVTVNIVLLAVSIATGQVN